MANRWQNSGCTCSGPDPTVLTILVSMISPSTTYQEAFAVAASAVVVYSIRISNRCVCLPCIFVGHLMLEYGIEIRRPPTSKILLLETQSICVGFFAVLLLVHGCKCLSRISFIWASSVLFVVIKRSLKALSDDIQDLLRSAACYEFYLPVDGAQGGLLLLRHSALALA